MATLRNLKKEALGSAKFRGHKMGAWNDNSDLKSSECQCTVCDAWAMVDTHPMPNGIDIGGSAVATGCGDGEPRIYKTFQDCCPGGKPMKLEAQVVGIYSDDKGQDWTVYKPISIECQGVYHLISLSGGLPWIASRLEERSIIAQ